MFTIRRRATSLGATTCSQQPSITRPRTPRGTISTPMPPSTTRQPARPSTTRQPQYYQAAEPTQTTATGTPVVPASYTVPVADAPASQPAQAVPEATYGDPYGFLYWLNSTRASYGLGPVNYDQNLSNWAAMNNSEQMARGLGHFVMGPARHQNSAAGGGFPGAMWMASPAHRAALLDPTISWIGIAAAGAYWTFNAS